MLAAGLALLALSRGAGRDTAGVIDAAIIAIGFGLLIASLAVTFAADMAFSVLALQGSDTAVTDADT